MTTIYVPRLIESVEQSEALPEDTPVLTKVDGEVFGLEFARDLLPEHMTPVHHARHYALVSIEAEEEWAAQFESGEMYVNLDEDSARAADGGTAMSRLVTPWEEEKENDDE